MLQKSRQSIGQCEKNQFLRNNYSMKVNIYYITKYLSLKQPSTV